MSQMHHPGYTPSSAESNPLGLAGFVVSLVGLCSGGVLSPIGLILSIIALGKRPKGFAIWGVVLGALGSCGILLAIVLVPIALAGVLAAAGLAGIGAALASSSGPEIETQIDTAFLSINLQEYERKNGRYPETLDVGLSQLRADSGLRKDHWDRPYAYQVAPDGSAYWVYSLGEDGLDGTADDIVSQVSIEKFGDRPAPATPAIPTPPDAGTDPDTIPGTTPEGDAPEAPATPPPSPTR